MKNLLYTLLLFSSLAFAQSSGITYQAVIYNPAGEELPGVDNPYAPLTDQDICLQFGIVDADGNLEYQEQVQVTTDPFGMVNLLIGTNTQTGGYAADFAGIQWTADAKFLKVDLDIKGSCTDFEELSNQPFTYVPFAYYSPASDVPGPEGPPGPVGPQGEPGPAGADGQDGVDGQDGAVGATGPAGPSGPAGPAGPQGPQGEQGPAGEDGENGSDGEGLNSLISITVEEAGDNCENGGIKIEVGLDLNRNNVLDVDEIQSELTSYICNGINGSGDEGGSGDGDGLTVECDGSDNLISSSNYQIGDLVDCGVVFYIAPVPTDLDGDGDLDNGLICSLDIIGDYVDSNPAVPWIPEDFPFDSPLREIFDTSKCLGEGATNTNLIINNYGVVDCTDENGMYSAMRATCYNPCGSGGWFLPSWEELYEIYDNRQLVNIAMFDNGAELVDGPGLYASSSECSQSGYSAFLRWNPSQQPNQGCGTSGTGGADKTAAHPIRAVKTF